MITYEAGFDYADGMTILHARLPFSQHYEALALRLKHCSSSAAPLMSRVMHRCTAAAAAGALHIFPNPGSVHLALCSDAVA